MELSDPRQGAFGGETLDLLVFPGMEVFRQLLLDDTAEFDETPIHGLENHKRHHTREETQNRISGLVPLRLLALACLAHDKAEHTGLLPVPGTQVPARAPGVKVLARRIPPLSPAP